MRDDLVAQLVEHITFNDGALGSSPSGITKLQKLAAFLFLIRFDKVYYNLEHKY